MSLWEAKEPAVDADVVRKFTTLAETSPRGVEAIDGSGALSSPLAGQPEKKTGERITELAQYFFKEVVARAITYMQHDYNTSYRVKHLVWALEQFASDVRQQQTLPPYIQGGDDVEDEDKEEEVEWTPPGFTGTAISNDADKSDEDMSDGEEDEEDEDEEAMQELVDREEEEAENMDPDEDEVPYALEYTDTSTPTFDEIFPPVDASAQCISMSVLAKTWNETGQMNHRSDLDVREEDEEAFYKKLNGALNAYVATMLLEPRKLDAAFAKVDA